MHLVGALRLQELRNLSDYALTWLKPPHPVLLDLAGACVLIFVLAATLLGKARPRRDVASSNRRVLACLVVGLLVVGLLSAVPGPALDEPYQCRPPLLFPLLRPAGLGAPSVLRETGRSLGAHRRRSPHSPCHW